MGQRQRLMTRVEIHEGPREALRPLFEEAEDSRPELDSYLESGRVFVALADGEIVGHLQLTETDSPAEVEVKNIAVLAAHRRQGIGATLMEAALALAREESRTLVRVATAAADVDNLRFYQRLGFRMRSIEPDAFVPATGYPAGTMIDGIELRDRVWFDRAP